MKFANIPDDPVFDENEEDPFNTDIATSIIKRETEDRKRAEKKLKFSGLNAVADVLSGKSDHLDKSLVEHTVKRKRRRGNRINLIGDDQNVVTAIDDIATQETRDLVHEKSESQDLGFELKPEALSNVPELVATELCPTEGSDNLNEYVEIVEKVSIDVTEFETIDKEIPTNLTSNIAILSGELNKPAEEETDDFDAAFDALAQESVTKSRIDDLEKQFENNDIFDTSCANKVLNLASLTDKVQELDENLNEDIEDPFDTSAFDQITGEVETDLEFEQLANRSEETPKTEPEPEAIQDCGISAFGSSIPQSSAGDGWAAFEKKKPPRPAPPKPRQPRAPTVSVTAIDPSDAPSVVVKAPSTESIKSWNISVAENLIRKVEESSAVEPVLEEDPFDTTHIEDFEEDNSKAVESSEDPFDTSGIKVDSIVTRICETQEDKPGDSESEKEEDVPDLISDTLTNNPLNGKDSDPFDTEFASDVLPDKGDPFDTSYVPQQDSSVSALDSLERECKGSLASSNIENTETIVKTASKIQVEDTEFDPTATFQRSKEERLQQEEEIDPFDTGIADSVVVPSAADKRVDNQDSDSDDFDPRA